MAMPYWNPILYNSFGIHIFYVINLKKYNFTLFLKLPSTGFECSGIQNDANPDWNKNSFNDILTIEYNNLRDLILFCDYDFLRIYFLN